MRKDFRELPLAKIISVGEYSKFEKVNGKKYPTKEYSHWHNAYHRTKEPYKKKYPSYVGVYMDEVLEDYDTFVVWAKSQINFDKVGFVLDKDLLGVVNGDRNYTTNTCVFIPTKINAFLMSKNKNVKHYTGVSFQQECQKYIVSCSQLNGKNKTLARTICPVEGYNIYRSEKVRLAKILAEQYEGLVDTRVINILSNFENYIDLFTVNPTNKGE